MVTSTTLTTGNRKMRQGETIGEVVITCRFAPEPIQHSYSKNKGAPVSVFWGLKTYGKRLVLERSL